MPLQTLAHIMSLGQDAADARRWSDAGSGMRHWPASADLLLGFWWRYSVLVYARAWTPDALINHQVGFHAL